MTAPETGEQRQYDEWIQERGDQAKKNLRAAMEQADEPVRAELQEAYRLIDDLMVALYGVPGTAVVDAPSAEVAPEEIQRINVLAARRTFFLQQQINSLNRLLEAASEFTFYPDLSAVEHGQYLDPLAWAVRIGKSSDKGLGGRWYMWRGSARNPDVYPPHAFYDGLRWVSADRVARRETLLMGGETYAYVAQRLEAAMAEHVADAARVAACIAEGKRKTYPPVANTRQKA